MPAYLKVCDHCGQPISIPKDERNTRRKEARLMYAAGTRPKELARHFGVTVSTIWSWVRGLPHVLSPRAVYTQEQRDRFVELLASGMKTKNIASEMDLDLEACYRWRYWVGVNGTTLPPRVSHAKS